MSNFFYNPNAWSQSVDAAVYLAYRLKPVVVDGPGIYETRAGRQVVIHSVGDRGALPCYGHHDCGTPDRWSAAGRILPFTLSDHDLVKKLSEITSH